MSYFAFSIPVISRPNPRINLDKVNQLTFSKNSSLVLWLFSPLFVSSDFLNSHSHLSSVLLSALWEFGLLLSLDVLK